RVGGGGRRVVVAKVEHVVDAEVPAAGGDGDVLRGAAVAPLDRQVDVGHGGSGQRAGQGAEGRSAFGNGPAGQGQRRDRNGRVVALFQALQGAQRLTPLAARAVLGGRVLAAVAE